MAKKARGVQIDGDVIGLHCPGCGSWPVRKSWLKEHDCGLDVCRVCREEGICQGCNPVPVGTPATEPGTR